MKKNFFSNFYATTTDFGSGFADYARNSGDFVLDFFREKYFERDDFSWK